MTRSPGTARSGDPPRKAGDVHRHEQAAARHEHAALTHDRAAAFWEEQGNRARTDLHRDAAEHERAGAALERRWAEVVASEEPADAVAGERDG
jgi:hypothetical protein